MDAYKKYNKKMGINISDEDSDDEDLVSRLDRF